VLQFGVRLDGTACQMNHRCADVFETVVTHLQYICCFVFWGWECTPTPRGPGADASTSLWRGSQGGNMIRIEPARDLAKRV